MLQKVKEALLAKFATLEAEVVQDISTSAGRIALEKQVAALLTELIPFVQKFNPGAAAGLQTVVSILGKAESVDADVSAVLP